MTEQNLHQWFAASARRLPQATALEVGRHRLSYAELDQAVSRLAGRMTPTGGPRPARVGLLASRSLTAYAGYLAALRLGAVVVPLNPSAPAARNAAICRLAAVDALIADDAGANSAAAIRGTLDPITVLHQPTAEEDRLLTGPVPDLPPCYRGPEDLAYLLFTSGSTGTPKGVPVRHRNLSTYLAFTIARYEAGPGCRFSQTYDLTFDPSMLDLFVCWGSGGTLVAADTGDLMQPVDFARNRGITHWSSVPSLISMASRQGALQPDAMPALRWSLFIGEQLTRDQAYAWAAAAPSSAVENCYGPTELTITCTAYRLPADPADHPPTANGTVPIGAVYPHLEHLLIDEHGQVGDEGELCVRGVQRFDGYVDPADNAGRFLTIRGRTAATYDGAGPLTDAYWYRTGDRVQRDNDVLTHLGRIDDQVKIRGYRVEPGEIEAALRRHADVEDAVVVSVRDDSGGETRLVAYYTGRLVPVREFLGIIRSTLPMYMLPSRFEHVAALPLTANGKTDRRRLAEESAGRI